MSKELFYVHEMTLNKNQSSQVLFETWNDALHKVISNASIKIKIPDLTIFFFFFLLLLSRTEPGK